MRGKEICSNFNMLAVKSHDSSRCYSLIELNMVH